MPPPPLPEELLEEIFLRLPPEEPAWLVRASLVSKLWLGLLHGPSFRGRYRELHGAPPMLGFLCRSSYNHIKEYPTPRFVSTGKFNPRFPQDEDWGCHGYGALDCRHGRVLLGNTRRGKAMALSVWDPMTGRHMELDAPEYYGSHGAAVLCAVTGCDHSACHDGPFQVIYVGLGTSDGAWFARAHTSLPQMGEWSKPCSQLHLSDYAYFDGRPPVLTEDALYFVLLDEDDDDYDISILKYDLGSNCLSLIDAPLLEISTADDDFVLMGMEGGCLGFARLNMLTLYLWSMQMGSNGVASWTACRVIDLAEFLPIQNPKKELSLTGSVEGSDIIFVTTDLGTYEISLKSLEWKKIWKRADFYALVPYMSFYDPLGRANPCDVAR